MILREIHTKTTHLAPNSTKKHTTWVTFQMRGPLQGCVGSPYPCGGSSPPGRWGHLATCSQQLLAATTVTTNKFNNFKDNAIIINITTNSVFTINSCTIINITANDITNSINATNIITNNIHGET